MSARINAGRSKLRRVIYAHYVIVTYYICGMIYTVWIHLVITPLRGLYIRNPMPGRSVILNPMFATSAPDNPKSRMLINPTVRCGKYYLLRRGL